MDENHRPNELELEEGNARSIRSIEAGYDSLALRNHSGEAIDELTLADDLGRIKGIEEIKSLIVKPSSKVKNLLFLKALPAVETLQLNGLQLRSFDGLEWFGHGRFINVDTGKNRNRDIKKIAETPIRKLSLYWANPGDLEAIGRSTTIREVTVSNCPRLSFVRWRNVPIESMGLFDGALDEIADTGHVGNLRKLTLFSCRNLKRFAGDNGNVTWMVIQMCNRLDLPTIATFRALEFITVVGMRQELPLSAFAALDQLQSLSLQQCKIQVDVMDLKSSAMKLGKLLITGLKKGEVAELSKANKGVLVSNGVWSYKDGIPSVRQGT